MSYALVTKVTAPEGGTLLSICAGNDDALRGVTWVLTSNFRLSEIVTSSALGGRDLEGSVPTAFQLLFRVVPRWLTEQEWDFPPECILVCVLTGNGQRFAPIREESSDSPVTELQSPVLEEEDRNS